jgi:hypothetical protein
MITLTLGSEEQRLLSEVLARRLRELTIEIPRTDHRGFRGMLRHEADLLGAVLERLEVRQPVAG